MPTENIEVQKILKKITTEFIKGLLDDISPENMCFIVCVCLSGYLDFLGYRNCVIEGDIHQNQQIHQHFWLDFESFIIDPTASQFKKPNGKNMPKIYIGAKPKWYLIK